jgi:hypothetical protein
MATASERLLARLPKQDSPFVGVDDIATLECDQAVAEDILLCVYSTDVLEIVWGLWFVLGLAGVGKLNDELANIVARQLPSIIGLGSADSSNAGARECALELGVALRNRLPKYRELMLESLSDPVVGIRHVALQNCTTFLEKNELEPLLIFKDDPYIMETSMSGPLVYSLRDLALSKIESIVGKHFETSRRSQVLDDGAIVSWRDWAPFLRWWEKSKSATGRWNWIWGWK